MTSRPLALAVLLGCAACAEPEADQGRKGIMKVIGGYAYSPVATEAAAYVTLQNVGRLPDTLVAMSTSFAGAVVVHEGREAGSAIKMVEVNPLVIPAGLLIEMAPGGMHLMLTDLRMPLPAGKRLDLKLRFAKSGELAVELPIVKYGEAP